MAESVMLDVVWRIDSENFDPQSFAERFKLKPSMLYIKGEKGFRGVVNDNSGMNIPVFEIEENDFDEGIEDFFIENKEAISELLEEGIESVIDLGAYVDASEHPIYSVRISPRIMGLFHEHNIHLEFSTYWSSKEAESESPN